MAAALAVTACGAGATHRVGSGPARSYGGWCQAQLTAAWRRVLSSHIVPLSRTTSLVPFALAPNGRSFFAVVRSPHFSGVARIGSGAHDMTEIKAFPAPNTYQADGSFDGRWFVWYEYHGFSSFDDFKIYAWDSRTGRVKRIGAAAKGPTGELWASPWQGPDVRNGLATWAQGSGPNGLTRVHVYDLRAARDRVIHTGYTEGPFLLPHRLVAWAESPKRGAYVQMFSANALTGKRVAAPPALRVLRGISGLDTDGRQIAYPSARFRSLWWASSLRAEPTEILAARGLDTIDNSVQVGGRYVGFGIQPPLFLADTKTRRYLEIERQFGYTELNPNALLVDYGNNTKKRLDFRSHVVLVPLRALPRMPACHS
ncbi:MAG TPA: hypothetical protein VGM45_06290 [Gaiellaceae bacterium]|jgi:hypothetical protein